MQQCEIALYAERLSRWIHFVKEEVVEYSFDKSTKEYEVKFINGSSKKYPEKLVKLVK